MDAGRGTFIDCHCHLAANDFKEDLAEVISRATNNGVEAALVVAEHHGEFERILELSRSFPCFVLPCLGVHPVQGLSPDTQRSVKENDIEEALLDIEKYADQLVAVGEVGLDFTPRIAKCSEDKDIQRLVLTKQIQLAKRLNLPLNVHSRSAGRPTIALLHEQGAENVLLHAFDGKPSVAMLGIQYGYYFSIPPSIVRSGQKQKLVKQLPLERILLETDSPALSAEKQKRNEPSNIHISCDYIAEVKGVSVETVRQITRENALRLFPKIQKFLKTR
ncbi:putative deoxyribonuclease TATDN3 isoform X1 [Lytechinus variegatus]|uniref:putative deoxyribonuclease TATDN3 isoform X1 n=1 Tax=Lytechinus variegatus TaxID=7654 RepID=UPI001BB2B910|nr:putative deoxyribonuclease TATDN3 isoform X1 [Lytechinus variegatus]